MNYARSSSSCSKQQSPEHEGERPGTLGGMEFLLQRYGMRATTECMPSYLHSSVVVVFALVPDSKHGYG